MGPDQWVPWIPPAIGVAIVVGQLLLQWIKRSDAKADTTWDQMRELIEELRHVADQYRARAERAEAERDAYLARYGPLPDDRRGPRPSGGWDL